METSSSNPTIFLKDYTPFPYRLIETRLEFFLDPTATRVVAELDFEGDGRSDLALDGEELQLNSVAINGEEVKFGDMGVEGGQLVVDADTLPAGAFTLRTEVTINPEDNSTLTGLYLSSGIFTTQCEAQGFRRITYYPDRPDVLAPFYVTVHSDLPVRLSNGNLIEEGENWTKWHDPWPKPAYLFALVAGELAVNTDKFTTQSGRDVALMIYSDAKNIDQTDYAMDALKRSMVWDERVYGREYDLERFMVVVIDDFNSGAMENKGLNIFNSVLVLASPETATDLDYARIESVIAHEYFHNWTGNRVTLRDWFQLSLKEGLTVYRDQQFSGDERSHAVKRIEDVAQLRGRQFPEDAGPLAHPVQTDRYVAIDNFYTATVYEKGAELIGMMKTLVGDEAYAKALDIYFERHDGDAATIDDWLAVFTEVSGRDLSQFRLWYTQAGTPRIDVETTTKDGKMALKLQQSLAPTPNQSKKKPMHIPLRYTVYGDNGDAVDDGLIEMTEAEMTLTLDAPENGHLSINQGFSAPITLNQTPYDRGFLLRHDRDPFNRWEAGRQSALIALDDDAARADYITALGEIIADETLDPDYRAFMLGLPNFDEIAARVKAAGETPDPERILASQKSLRVAIATALEPQLREIYDEMATIGDAIDPVSAGKRALRLASLRYLVELDDGVVLAQAHFDAANLMTDMAASLALLVQQGAGATALEQFYKRFEENPLVIDKWFAIQAQNAPAEDAVETVKTLASHEAFQNANPNRFRALVAGFAVRNYGGFHDKSGDGYRFYADQLIQFDAKNPQTAARASVGFQSWRDFDEGRQTEAKAALQQIANAPNLSKNLGEMVTRLLG